MGLFTQVIRGRAKVMENLGLLYIPDISGFTKFVTQTEIEHSNVIISDLIEVVIKSNRH